MPKIYAPAKVAGKVSTYFGPHNVTFEDGVAEFDSELSDGLRAYLLGAGYGIDEDAPDPAEDEPEPADPRDHDNAEVVGTPLRDAAVDPQPEDFLAPTNAGEANPHGPDVVSPGIHAVTGPGPIVPGTVGSKEYQDAKESATAEAVLVDGVKATEVGAALGGLASEEYKLTEKDGLAREVEDLTVSDVDDHIEDGPDPADTADPAPEPEAQPEPQEPEPEPDPEPEPEADVELKGQALEAALEERGLVKTGTADEKRARVAEHDARAKGQA